MLITLPFTWGGYTVSNKLSFPPVITHCCYIQRASSRHGVPARLARPSVLPAQPPQPVGEEVRHHRRWHRDLFLDVCHQHAADLWPRMYNFLRRRPNVFVSSAALSSHMLPYFAACTCLSIFRASCFDSSFLPVSPSVLWKS